MYYSLVEILTADTDEERLEVRDFLAEYIDDIAPDAVPAVRNNNFYRPLVPVIRDSTGRIIAAALTCRSYLAAGAAVLQAGGGPVHPRAAHFLPVLDRHSELDLLAVRSEHQNNGVGARITGWMEDRLRLVGVRVWFGNVTTALDVTALRHFYSQRGFTVTAPGAPLPPLLGRDWVPPMVEQPAFYFYKTLANQAQVASRR